MRILAEIEEWGFDKLIDKNKSIRLAQSAKFNFAVIVNHINVLVY